MFFNSKIPAFVLVALIWLCGTPPQLALAQLNVSASPAAGCFDKSVTVSLTCNDSKATIYYTLDGSVPSAKSNVYKQAISLKQTAVVRAFALSGNKVAPLSTQTYFIGEKTSFPIYSISIKPAIFFHPEAGLFAKGPKAKPTFPFYGANFWSRKEYVCHLEIFDKGARVFDGDVGISIFGGNSRTFPMKSLALVARKRYGPKTIHYAAFENRPFKKYKHLILRNSGTDFCNTHFRDDMITSLAEDMGMEVQGSRPVIGYINGAYWGIYNLREKLNRYFVANHYGVDKDSVNLIEHRQDVKQGSIATYQALRKFLLNPQNNLSDQKKYDYVSTQMDIDNFMLHQVVEIYIDNQDAGGNIKFWSERKPHSKWRWLLFDTDFGFSFYDSKAYANNSLEEHTAADGPAWPNPPWSTLNLRKLMENVGFRRKLINRFCDVMNTAFKPEHVIERIDFFQKRVEGEMPRHLTRWKHSVEPWYNRVELLRKFARERPAYMRQHLQARFDCGSTVNLSVQTEGNGKVLINNFVTAKGRFDGIYFKNIPVTLQAIPDFGYRFAAWKNVSLKGAQTSLSFAAPHTEVVAVFERVVSKLEHKIVVNEIGFRPETVATPVAPKVTVKKGKTTPAATPKVATVTDWIELYNQTSSEQSLDAWHLKVNDDDFRLPAVKIPANGYLVVCRDTLAFRKVYPKGVITFAVVKGFKLNTAKASIQLCAADEAGIDSTGYALEAQDGSQVLVCSLTKTDKALNRTWALEKVKHATPGIDNPTEARRKRDERRHQIIVLIGGLIVVAILIFFMVKFWLKTRVPKIEEELAEQDDPTTPTEV